MGQAFKGKQLVRKRLREVIEIRGAALERPRCADEQQAVSERQGSGKGVVVGARGPREFGNLFPRSGCLGLSSEDVERAGVMAEAVVSRCADHDQVLIHGQGVAELIAGRAVGRR